VDIGRLPRAFTIARIHAIEITLNWRWVPVLGLTTFLLAQNVLPARFPLWEMSTTWLTSFAVVLAGQAETIAAAGLPAPGHEALIALVGPGMNVALAGLAEALRLGFATQGPVDVALLLLVLSNAAMAAMSLLPLGGSDGDRALSALRRSRSSGCL
jgi:hypothetical protein